MKKKVVNLMNKEVSEVELPESVFGVKIFPDIKIQRMDFDSVKKKGGHKKILNQFSKSDMLLGTQI